MWCRFTWKQARLSQSLWDNISATVIAYANTRKLETGCLTIQDRTRCISVGADRLIRSAITATSPNGRPHEVPPHRGRQPLYAPTIGLR